VRFYCGPSFAERRIRAAQKYSERLKYWHPYFCFLPRRIGPSCYWLETVLRIARQGYCKDSYGGYVMEWYFDYRARGEV
jgi:hypothetical protein